MRQPELFKPRTPLAGKIHRLHRLLVKEKTLFEEVADHVPDRSLRRTILSLAQQNNQYAAELSAYMKSTGDLHSDTMHSAKKQKAVLADGDTEYPNERKVLSFCSSNERKIVLAYRRLLQESIFYESLQKMMNYQLNGILAAITQLKLLRSLQKV